MGTEEMPFTPLSCPPEWERGEGTWTQENGFCFWHSPIPGVHADPLEWEQWPKWPGSPQPWGSVEEEPKMHVRMIAGEGMEEEGTTPPFVNNGEVDDLLLQMEAYKRVIGSSAIEASPAQLKAQPHD